MSINLWNLLHTVPQGVEQLLTPHGTHLSPAGAPSPMEAQEQAALRLLHSLVHGASRLLYSEDSVSFLGSVIFTPRDRVPGHAGATHLIMDGLWQIEALLLLVLVLRAYLEADARQPLTPWLAGRQAQLTGRMSSILQIDSWIQGAIWRYTPWSEQGAPEIAALPRLQAALESLWGGRALPGGEALPPLGPIWESHALQVRFFQSAPSAGELSAMGEAGEEAVGAVRRVLLARYLLERAVVLEIQAWKQSDAEALTRALHAGQPLLS